MLCYNKTLSNNRTKNNALLTSTRTTVQIFTPGGAAQVPKQSPRHRTPEPRLRSPVAAPAYECTCWYSLLMGNIVVPPAIYLCVSSEPQCVASIAWRLTCVIYLMFDQRAGMVSNGAGKSRQGLPKPSSHGSAIPRLSSHFGDRETSLLGCRLRVRRPAKVSKRRDAGQPRLR